MEPRIGSYRLELHLSSFDENGVPSFNGEELAFHEVELSTDERAAKLFTFYGQQIKGIYTPTDVSRLLISISGNK